MANLTSVGISAGVPNSGTGTVSTIDNIPALWDKGAGTGGSLTQRVTIDSSQLGSLGKQVDAGSTSVVYSSGSTLPGRAHTAAPSAVTDGQQAEIITDKVGKLISVGSIRDLKGEANLTLTASTAETTLIAAVASTFLDLYGLILTNISATATEVIIRDATGGGTARSFMVPAGETRGFMLPEGGAIKQATVNNNWTAQCVTSITSLKIDALYVRNI